MDAEEIIKLVRRTPTEELLTEERLREYLNQGIKLRHYIGLEISGYVHIGTGIICMEKVADFQRAGIETIVFLADYHSWINRKLGGDLDTIKRVAGGYFKEALKQSLKVVGGDPDKTRFIMGSELYEKEGLKYFENVIKVSMKTTLSRVRRSITIMGRKRGGSLDFAQLIYVPMQVADIFTLKVNLAHGGIDQRKAHVIAIDVGEKAFGYKPIAVHHHLIMGLDLTSKEWKAIIKAKMEGRREVFEDSVIEIKMSKSRPGSAIFIHDSEDEIKMKIRKAFCPFKQVEFNPIIEILEYIISRNISEDEIVIVNEKTGEKMSFESFDEVKRAYGEGKIHPLDLKNYVAEKLIELLKPIRKHFREGSGKSLIEEMESIRITR